MDALGHCTLFGGHASCFGAYLMKIKRFFRNLNYRHYICIAITLGFVACSVFVFPNAFGRIVEACRDLGLSIAYYFCELFEIPYNFNVTVNDLPKVPFFAFLSGAPFSTFLPETWEGFKLRFVNYWKLWASGGNVLGYLNFLGRLLCGIVLAVLPLLLIILVCRIAISRYLHNENSNDNVESRPFRVFKCIMDHTYRPVKFFFMGFFAFVREHKKYVWTWVCIWAFNFNFFTIFIEFFAYCFYFALSFDFGHLYMQIYKLFLDLWPMLTFIPLWLWILVAVFGLDRFAKRVALRRLYHNERRNRGFINERGIMSVVYGPMGVGKTTQITDMALSSEVQMLDDALEVLIETDMRFPFFPWVNLESAMKRMIAWHGVWDIASVRRWVRRKRDYWQLCRCRGRIFDYDFERYGLDYDDKLKLVNIWDAIEDYACAYFIYVVQSSYIVSNYSVRSDKLMSYIGNFPLWDTDFFRRDSRLIDSYSRYSHILDYDMLRLGKKMLEDNPNRNAFGFGVYVISEIDKELKNAPTLKDAGIAAKNEECNQKNDLTITCLKMIRHACVVANKVFVKIFADLQRPSSLGADALELGEVIEICGKGEMKPVLPFFSPFWFVDLIASAVGARYKSFWTNEKFIRTDCTLFRYFVRTIVSKLGHYRERIYDFYGVQTLSLRVEHGSRDGDFVERKYYRMPKKIYSKRFSTDGLSYVFEVRSDMNYVGLDDLRDYGGVMATADEWSYQNSHFGHDVDVMNENAQ